MLNDTLQEFVNVLREEAVASGRPLTFTEAERLWFSVGMNNHFPHENLKQCVDAAIEKRKKR